MAKVEGEPNKHSEQKRSNISLTKAEIRAHVQAGKADLERQFESTKAQVLATKAQFDSTNEKIEAFAGRNVFFAVFIGLALGLTMLFSLIFAKQLFLFVVLALVILITVEFVDVLRTKNIRVPLIPALSGVISLVPASYFAGERGQFLALVFGATLSLVWRGFEHVVRKNNSTREEFQRDLLVTVFVSLYIGLFASFAVLLLAKEGGQWWVLVSLLLVIASDTGAYISGLVFGKHPLSPRISPKKTWEGFAGGTLLCLTLGAVLAPVLLGQHFVVGLIFASAILVTATLGDLVESLLKRDLGVKDMSSWLPGHGGFLDRLDSILPSCFIAYVFYLIFVV